jgi:dihydrofolate synthase/folylpolyglutamate synthase
MIPGAFPYADLLVRLERTSASGVVMGLERTRAALARLGDPQRAAVTVHLAGTNGKGSTAAMTESILRAGGVRTGLYTSPHLCRFTERIRVDGRELDGDHLAALVAAIDDSAAPLTYFELATVLAFRAFAAAGVEVMVLETGLGGRLDATTCCEPVATAITSIALDHADVLGPTLSDIAREKAGIAKPGVPLFLAPVPPEADAEIEDIAGRVGAPLRRFGQDFGIPPAAPALAGDHQITNAAVAVALAQAAAQALGRTLSAEAIEIGLRAVVWPGRLELIQSVLFDCAHNTEGAAALAAALDRTVGPRRALVFSAVRGKPAAEMLAILVPRFDAVFLTRSSNERSIPPEQLRGLTPPGLPSPVVTVAPAADAMAAAQSAVGWDGMVVVAGSTFLVGDLRAALLGEMCDPLPTSDPLSIPPV